METQLLSKKLEELFEKYGYENCSVREVKIKKNHILLICDERNPFEDDEFIIEYKNERFLNSNEEDLEELYKLNQ